MITDKYGIHYDSVYETPYGCPFKDRCDKVGEARNKYGMRVVTCFDGTYYEACNEFPININIKKLGCEYRDRCEKYKRLNSAEKKHLCYRDYHYFEKCVAYEVYMKKYGCEYKNRCEEYTKYTSEWAKLHNCHKAYRYKECRHRQAFAEKDALRLKRIKKGGAVVAVAVIISIILKLIGIIQ